MKRLTTRGIATAEAIRDRESFNTSGALRGRTVADGGLSPYGYTGYLNDTETTKWRQDCYHIDYVVWSYNTPIAWHWSNETSGEEGWHIVDQKFSLTTTKHQGNLYLIPRREDQPA